MGDRCLGRMTYELLLGLLNVLAHDASEDDEDLIAKAFKVVAVPVVKLPLLEEMNHGMESLLVVLFKRPRANKIRRTSR